MVRILEQRTIDGNTNYVEAVGLSTDSKPTANICTGSVFTEVDTGDVYMFDEEGGTWYGINGGGDNEPGLPIMDGVVAN